MMEKHITEIENDYQRLVTPESKANVDFFGLNIVNSPGQQITAKRYSSQKVSRNGDHPLVDFVRRREMLRYFADVSASARPDIRRMDISLTQRSDANIEALFSYLTAYAPFFLPHLPEVEQVAAMPITDTPGYRYASLYHVGFVESDGVPDLLKFHFFTRWCPDPNHHPKEGYRDALFLTYLRESAPPPYRILCDKAEAILHNCGGHLWMAGLDLFPDRVKHKIYLKNINNAYQYLPQLLCPDAAAQLQAVSLWNERHSECRLAGAAVALDSRNTTSLNLYYHVD